MEITKEMFEQHPNYKEYLTQQKKFQVFDITIRIILILLGLIFFFFVGMDNYGNSPLKLTTFIFDDFFDREIGSFMTLCITLLFPIWFVFENVGSLSSSINFKKRPACLLLFKVSKKRLWGYSILKLIIPIVPILILDNYYTKALNFDISPWVTLTILCAVLNCVYWVFYCLLIKKWSFIVSDVIPEEDKENHTIDKALQENFLAEVKQSPIKFIYQECFMLVMIAVFFLISLFSPMYFNFSYRYSLPEELGLDVDKMNISLTHDQMEECYQKGTSTIEIYSNNYEFYNKRLQKLEIQYKLKEEEILLTPLYSLTREKFDKFQEELKEIKNEINYCKIAMQKIDYQKISVLIECYPVGDGGYRFRVLEASLNTDANNLDTKKVEKITLDKSNFYAKITNFSQEKITATVEYEDGSKRISYVKPDNIYELNIANAGQHMLKWSDSWGSYSYAITLS